jgi:hypothetical protein
MKLADRAVFAATRTAEAAEVAREAQAQRAIELARQAKLAAREAKEEQRVLAHAEKALFARGAHFHHQKEPAALIAAMKLQAKADDYQSDRLPALPLAGDVTLTPNGLRKLGVGSLRVLSSADARAVDFDALSAAVRRHLEDYARDGRSARLQQRSEDQSYFYERCNKALPLLEPVPLTGFYEATSVARATFAPTRKKVVSGPLPLTSISPRGSKSNSARRAS